jgi:hypothetical protein
MGFNSICVNEIHLKSFTWKDEASNNHGIVVRYLQNSQGWLIVVEKIPIDT